LYTYGTARTEWGYTVRTGEKTDSVKMLIICSRKREGNAEEKTSHERSGSERGIDFSIFRKAKKKKVRDFGNFILIKKKKWGRIVGVGGKPKNWSGNDRGCKTITSRAMILAKN